MILYMFDSEILQKHSKEYKGKVYNGLTLLDEKGNVLQVNCSNSFDKKVFDDLIVREKYDFQCVYGVGKKGAYLILGGIIENEDEGEIQE